MSTTEPSEVDAMRERWLRQVVRVSADAGLRDWPDWQAPYASVCADGATPADLVGSLEGWVTDPFGTVLRWFRVYRDARVSSWVDQRGMVWLTIDYRGLEVEP